jgi:cytochrome c-type biogenesis protein CcmH/NrfF
MQEPHLTMAAHILLWVFPAVLVVLVVASLIHDSLAPEDLG